MGFLADPVVINGTLEAVVEGHLERSIANSTQQHSQVFSHFDGSIFSYPIMMLICQTFKNYVSFLIKFFLQMDL